MGQRFKKRFSFYGAMVLLLWTSNVFSQEREVRNYDKQKLVRELIIPSYVFKLKLSKEQMEKFVPIFEEYDQKRDDLKRKVRENFTENRKKNIKKMKKEVQGLREETEVKLNGILTKGQIKEFRKLDQKLEDQGGKGEKAHGQRGGQRGSKRKGSEKGLGLFLTHL